MDAATDPGIEARLEALSREYASLAAARQPIDERMSQIRDAYRSLLDYGTSKHAGLTISIQHNVVFDPGRFAAAYPVMQYPQLYKSAPDMNAIRENLPPAELRSFHKEGAPKVVIT